MNRGIQYQGQNPLETDILNAQKDAYLAISKVIESLIGTATAAYGLSCGPTTPGSLAVVIQPGVIYQAQQLDANPYSTLGTDSHTVMKQGILLDAITLPCTAPVTAGYSINYLVQAQVQEVDGGSTILPYYNSANPNASFNGPSNTGASQNTRRFDNCNVTVKAGAAATTGTQTTPAADSGFMPLFVVTVAYGQTAINSSNIAQHASAVFMPDLSQTPVKSIIASGTTSAIAAGTGATINLGNNGGGYYLVKIFCSGNFAVFQGSTTTLNPYYQILTTSSMDQLLITNPSGTGTSITFTYSVMLLG